MGRTLQLHGGRIAAAAMLLAFAALAWGQDEPHTAGDVLGQVFVFDVAAQPLSSAVIELSKQAGVQVAMAGGHLDAYYSDGLHGEFALREALARLLADTPFRYRQTGARTITIDVASGERAGPGSPSSTGLAAAEASAADTAASDGEVVATIPVEPLRPASQAQTAQADDPALLDPILVTATKRSQDLREIAASVAALSGDTLEKAGAQSFEDYLKLVPGVAMNRSDADKSAPIIRGIAADTLPGIGSRTTGIFVDEIPLNDLFLVSANIDMNPFDLERVEVLKGPQGTLFGSSAIAGAIRYITRKPEPSVWLAKLHGTYTSTAHGERKPLGAAMVNVPIGRSAAVRAVGLVRESPGYIDDVGRGLPDVGDVRQETARVLGRWTPIEELDLTATWLRQDSYVDDTEFADQTERLERSNTNGPNTRDSTFSVANLVASYAFDWGTVLSNSSRITKDNYTIINADRGLPALGDTGPEDQPQPLLNAYAEAATTGFTQELRVSSPESSDRWQWLAGLAYLRFDSFNTSNNSGPLNPPVAGDTVTVAYTEFDAVASERAVFAELSRRWGDRWDLTLGGRYFQTRLVADTLIRGATQLLNGQTEARSHPTMEEAGFNPKVSLRFGLTPDVSFYLLAARGFQFGGVQLSPPSRSNDALVALEGGPAFEPYDSSTLWNYELGARTQWWRGRLQVDATLFYMDWRDLQLAQLVYSQGRPITTVYTNVGRAHSQGAELSLRLTPIRGLSLTSAAAYVDAATDVLLETSGGNYPPGTRLPGSAHFQTANTLAYQQPFSLLGNWTASASLTYAYTGRIYNDLAHSAQFGDYETLDCGIRLVNEDLRLQPDLSLTVSNLLDERGISGIGTCNGCRFKDVYFIRPRTSMLALTIRF